MSEQQADWKAIALALAQRVNYAVSNCECKGSGLLNLETLAVTPWRDYMVEALEMIPGVTVDREMLATLHLAPTKRRKAQAELKAKRAKEAK